MIALGIQELIKGDFTAVWQPVPKNVAAREVLVYLCAPISLASGIGLIWRCTAAVAARVLLASLIVWLMLWRVRAVFWARLAAALSVLQMGLFALLVWIPILMAGNGKAFQWGEFATTLALARPVGWWRIPTAAFPGSPRASRIGRQLWRLTDRQRPL